MSAEQPINSTEEPQPARKWLQAEVNRVWLMAELCLRHFQRGQLRPQPEHPSIAEVENIFAVRRQARKSGSSGPLDVAELTRSLEAVEAKLPELRSSAPIGRLVATLGLRPMELEALVVAMAPHVDAPLAEVFQLLRGQSNRRGVDLAMVSLLHRMKRDERIYLLDALDPDRPLLSWRLVQAMPVETPEGYGSVYYRAIQPTFDLLSVLFGRNELSSNLASYSELRVGEARLDNLLLDAPLRDQVEQLCASFAMADKQGPSAKLPWVLLWGGRGVGKREIATRAAAYIGKPLLTFNIMSVEPNAIDETLRRAQREALLRGAVLYVGPLTELALADQGRALLRRFENYPSVVIFGVESLQPPRLKIHRALQEIEIGLPPEAIRQELWERWIPPAARAADVQLVSLARSFKLTPGEISETAQEGLAIARLRPTGQIGHAELRAGIGRRLRNELADLARRITVVAKWKDLVLPPEDMFRVREFINRALYARQVYTEWGFDERIGYGKGMIALFSGPPGTGKTMLAGLIAAALDLDMYQVDLAQVVSKWVGETEKQLAKVFDQAERAHAVLLFDEADSLFAKRTEVKSSNDRYGNLAVNYLLQRLEQYSGVAVLTTNKEAALDEALQRRLTLHLHLEIPEQEERERLWKSFMPTKLRRSKDIDFKALAQEYELSGGYIKNVAVRAAFLAAAEKSAVNMSILRRAAALELEDQGKLVSNTQFRASATDD
jgi:MoxR-like ATPase